MALAYPTAELALEPEPAAAALPAWVGMLEPVWQLSKRLERAGEFLPESFANRPEAIMAAILTGLEVGQGPLWSLRSIFVVNGRPGMYAEAQRALVLGAGHELWPVEQSGERVTMAGRRRGSEHTVQVTWTLAEATKARLTTRNAAWQSYPRQMLTARATAELCRLLFADVIGGIAAAEELADGVVLAPVAEVPGPKPRTRKRADAAAAAEPVPALAGGAPASVEGTSEVHVEHPPLPGEEGYETEPEEGAPVDLPTRGRLMAMVTKAFPGTPKGTRDLYRHALTCLVTRDRESGPTPHYGELEGADLLALSARLEDVRAGRLLMATEPSGAVVATTATKQALIMPPSAEGESWSVVIEERER